MTRRRANREGSLYRRASDGRWIGAVALPNGRCRYFTGRRQEDVLSRLRDALKQTGDGLPLPGQRLTLGQYLATWLEAVRPSLRPESFRRYEDACRLHITPSLGMVPLVKLEPERVQALYSRLLAKGLSGTSVQLVHGVLHRALRQAVRWKKAQRNVCDLVDAPRRTTPEMRALSPEEARRLLDACEGHHLEGFFVLAVTAGLRLGELQALRWSDIDLDGARLRVTRSFQGIVDGVPAFSEPKTQKSRREIHLSALAVASLRRHRVAQTEARLRSPYWENLGLIFTTDTGRPLDGNNIRARSFARLLVKAGLPPMRLHDLRHTAATLLMAEGVPVKVASEMLGHADVTTTLRIYSHVLPGMGEAAADAMDRVFAGRT